MVGSGFNGPRIYELLMRAENCKLVLLSGTPIINHAYELALIANMLRGFINSIVFKICLTVVFPLIAGQSLGPPLFVWKRNPRRREPYEPRKSGFP